MPKHLVCISPAHMDPNYEIERRISVPVSYRNVPAPLELTGEQTDRVTVHVRGDDNVVSALTEAGAKVVDIPSQIGSALQDLGVSPRVDVPVG